MLIDCVAANWTEGVNEDEWTGGMKAKSKWRGQSGGSIVIEHGGVKNNWPLRPVIFFGNGHPVRIVVMAFGQMQT